MVDFLVFIAVLCGISFIITGIAILEFAGGVLFGLAITGWILYAVDVVDKNVSKNRSKCAHT